MTSDQLSSLLLPLLLVVAFWVLVIRPARRRQRELASTQASLQPGSRVMLTSGVYGEVASLDGTEMGLTVAPGVTLTVARQAVAKVVQPSADSGAEAVGGATAVSAAGPLREPPLPDEAAPGSVNQHSTDR